MRKQDIIALFLGFIFGVLLAIALNGCGHQPEVKKYDTDWTRKMFCDNESCPAFAQIHNYTLLTDRYDGKHNSCVCKLMSDNIPDAFEVSIPIDAPADAPVDSL